MHVSKFSWTSESQISENKNITTAVVILMWLRMASAMIGWKKVILPLVVFSLIF